VASRDRTHLVVCLLPLLILPACVSQPPDSAPGKSPASLPDDARPHEEPRSRYGNGPLYEVYGESYRVLDSSYGYQERGVASWYGKKFHGRKTSNQETYDMHAMTAAHKTLPLPTYVRVRNLKNNRSIVVRVNDRGPFVDNRLIDLSYSAALKLDMIQAGTGLVEITAISFDEAPAPSAAVKPVTASPASAGNIAQIYVQVGAFGDAQNARRRLALLRDNGISKTFVQEDTARSPTLYRVRIGPIADVTQFDALVARLKKLGIAESHLVTD
jgi:rare lipoprotein A